MDPLTNMENKFMRDAGADGYTTSQSKDVPDRENLPSTEAENADIKITDGVNPGEGDDGDATDEPSGSSSSFQDTFSGEDDPLGLSDGEISSEFLGTRQPAWTYPGYKGTFRMGRRKKLTSHWRNFIGPVMWRCKWAELKMKKFRSQTSMYSRVLAEYDQGSQSQQENFTAGSPCSRSLPLPHQMKCKKIMQRKKRKRVEDTMDVTSYMLQHNLFGYCESKATSTCNDPLINGYGKSVISAVRNGVINLGNIDDLIQFGDEKTSLEQILANLLSMQLRVHDLTTRVDKVINEIPGRFMSLNQLSMLEASDSGASTAEDPTPPSSDKDKGSVTSPSTATQAAPELPIEEISMNEIPVIADQVVDSLSNIAESVGQTVPASESDNAEDENPLKKRPISDELIVYRRGILCAKKSKMPSEKQSNISFSASAMRPQIGTQAHNEKSSVFLASRYTSLQNNQKKRGHRKGVTSGTRVQEGSLNGKSLKAGAAPDSDYEWT